MDYAPPASGHLAPADDRISPEVYAMVPASFSLDMNRRDFLRRASVVALAGGALAEHARGQDAKFVVAETNFGKIRGVEGKVG